MRASRRVARRWLPGVTPAGALRAGVLLAGALLGCGETAEPTAPVDAATDGTPTDLGSAADGGDRLDAGPVGQPCSEDAQCRGICVDDGAGPRCATPCVADAEAMACRDDLVCRLVEGRAACLAPRPAPGARGAPCADGRGCEPGLLCTGDHPAGVVCAPACASDADCPPAAGTPPERCAPETVTPQVCLPADAPALACPSVPCRRPDLLCVVPEPSPEDPDRLAAGLCVEPCEALDVPCPGGGWCTRRAADGARFCAPRSDRPAGAACASGGLEACAPGLTCTERWPGDARAVCATACTSQGDGDGCAPGFACRRPAGSTQTWCLAVPFGVGDAAGPEGASCAVHGATDCRPDLDCVAGPAGPVCAAPCAAGGGCAEGAACLERQQDGPYCLVGAGEIGGACDASVPCVVGTCHAPPEAGGDPDARRCARLCDAAAPNLGCAAGERCRDGICSADGAGMAPVGAACGDGLPGCASGLCVADPADGRARCTVPCVEGRCEAGLVCRGVADRFFCFPQAEDGN